MLQPIILGSLCIYDTTNFVIFTRSEILPQYIVSRTQDASRKEKLAQGTIGKT